MYKLQRSPLIAVLAKVQFAPVLQIKETVPAIQEEVRKKGFPLFDEEYIHNLSLPVAPGVRWVFRSPDRREGFVLTPEFVVLATNKYDTFANFEEAFLLILQILKDKVQPQLALRLELRYVDLVRELDSLPACQFVKEQFRGPSGTIFDGPETVTHYSLTQIPASIGLLNLKVSHHHDGTYLPPDLQADHGLQIDRPNLTNQEEVTILDIDHVSELNPPSPFDPDDLINVFDQLHISTDKAFQAIVTNEALTLCRK